MANKEDISNFSILIETIVREKEITYMEAIVYHCEQTGFEIEVAAKLISNALKSKIKLEAESLNYLPRSNTTKLPI